MKPWKRIEPTVTAKVGHRMVITKLFELSDGTVHDFQTFDREGQEYAGVVALTPDNQAIIIEQFRPGPEQMMLDIPGGFVDEGETPEQAAARELEEETGYKAGNLEYLGKVYKDPYNNATWHFFLATDCVETGKGQALEETEEAGLKHISIDEFIANAKQARMADVEAVFLAYDKLLELR
ncbi:MAG: NUDIX hydrolase [Candidatus Saccharibacteria bacterium]